MVVVIEKIIVVVLEIFSVFRIFLCPLLPTPSYALRRSQQGVPRALCGRLDGLCAWPPNREDSSHRKSRRARSKRDSGHPFVVVVVAIDVGAVFICSSFSGALPTPPGSPPCHGSPEDRGEASEPNWNPGQQHR